MRQLRRCLVLAPACLVLACATRSPPRLAGSPSDGEVLPLVRVRLYASGVGYFERRGDLNAGQRRLPVPAGHLDDALKSLVLINSGADPVGVTFPSRVSPAVARARAGMAAAENAALSYDRLLAALRGEEVVVRLGSAARFGKAQLNGRVVEVVSVEPSHPSYDHGPVGANISKGTRDSGRTEADEHDASEHSTSPPVARLQLMLLSPDYGVIRFDLSELVSVRPLNARIMERFEAALAARVATRANPTEWLEISTGTHTLRDLRLGYLAEVPIWRTSYRLLIQAQGRAELQGWALVHNDTDETWREVRLELVDGAPSSFLFPLAAPRYQRRDLSTPTHELSSVPQLSTTTPDALWGDFSDYQGETVESITGSEGVGGLGLASGEGFGSGHGRIGGSHKTRAPSIQVDSSTQSSSDLLWVGDLVKQAGVLPPAERAVSVYQVPTPLNLLPQHSALLPFLRDEVAAKTIVWFSSPESKPERAIGLMNNTSNTLPEGPMAVFGQGGFLGEALLQSLQPGARQFACIGEESNFDLTMIESTRNSVRRHVDFQSRQLRVHMVVTTHSRLLFNNRSGAPAETYVGMSVVTNATLEGTDRIDFDSTTGKPFAVFDVVAGPGQERNVVAKQGIAHARNVESLGLDDLDELIRDQELPAEERSILTKARALVDQRNGVIRAREELEVELGASREDLEGLKQASREVGSKESREGSTVMTTRVLASHDELRKLEARKRSIEKDLELRNVALRAVLGELNAFRPKLLEERERGESTPKDQAP
ncbi:MAG TPA: hypothetical protein VKP30_21355 [Polyangiaceae bacterium]|nr:hypothetical protein [Polyangiaceae bacterium]